MDVRWTNGGHACQAHILTTARRSRSHMRGGHTATCRKSLTLARWQVEVSAAHLRFRAPRPLSLSTSASSVGWRSCDLLWAWPRFCSSGSPTATTRLEPGPPPGAGAGHASFTALYVCSCCCLHPGMNDIHDSSSCCLGSQTQVFGSGTLPASHNLPPAP